MKKLICLFGLINLTFISAYAQYDPGDIAIVRYNTDADDGFSFVVLTSIASGDSIFFTDEGWDDTAGLTGWRNSGEEHLKYISPGLSAGDVVHIEETSSDAFTVSGSGGTVSLIRGESFSLISGDQIIAYIGSEVRPDAPTFLAALNGDDGASTTTGSNDPITKWTRDGEVSSLQHSTIPDRLINGVTAVSVFGDNTTEVDNMIYNCSTTSGTKAELLIAINDRTNWTTDNSNNQPSDSVCSFTVNSNESVVISGDAGWRLLSIPKAGAVVTDVSDDSPVQGITGGDDPESDSNFYIYDNSGAFEEPVNVSTSWGDGLGFALYFYNNTTNGSAELPIALDVSGSEPASDVSVSLNSGAANRFTLVGNPFASNFNTGNLTVDTGAIQDNINFWNDGTSSYSTIDRTAGSGYIIAPWQGFWVETSDENVTTLKFPLTGKSTSGTTGTFYSKVLENRADISFTLSSERSFDEAIRLSFRDYAELGFDIADATKLIPLTTNYATMAFETDGILKSVESLPLELKEEVELDLIPRIMGLEKAELIFKWEGIESVPSGWELMLHDKETGKSIDMRAQTDYEFTEKGEVLTTTNKVIPLFNGTVAISQNISRSEESRFTITINPMIVSNEEEEGIQRFMLSQNYPNPFNPSTDIKYSIAESGKVNISVFNLMGQKLAVLVNERKNAGSYNVKWNAVQMVSGVYYYRLVSGGQTITRKMTLIK